MQYLQPMQRCWSTMTMPSSRLYVALVGQLRAQMASVQLLQRRGSQKRRVSGKAPFSTIFNQVALTSRGTDISALQATVQAWQAMHLRMSITIAYRFFFGHLLFLLVNIKPPPPPGADLPLAGANHQSQSSCYPFLKARTSR